MSGFTSGSPRKPPSITKFGPRPGTVLARLYDLVEAIPSWEGGVPAAIVAKALEPGTRQCFVRGGAGRPTVDAFPSPGEARVAPPAWIETTSDLIRLRGVPAGEIPTGLLIELTHEYWPRSLLSIRLIIAPKTHLPIVLPVRVLVDAEGYDGEGLAFADFLRERDGIPAAAGATRGQLLEAYDHVRLLDDRMIVRVPAGQGGVKIRANLDPYTAIAKHGHGGLEAALAATVIQVDQHVFSIDGSAEAKFLSLLADYAIGRADFVAVSAMRWAAIQAAIH